MRIGAGQTLIDAALERTGHPEGVWDMASLAGVSITDLVELGEMTDLAAVRNKRIVRLYAGTGTHASTELAEGIGGWAVGVFRVS